MNPTYYVLGLIFITLITAFWAYKGWETAQSLRQVISMSEDVCLTCAAITAATPHAPGGVVSAEYLKELEKQGTLLYQVAGHEYVPAKLVYVVQELSRTQDRPIIPPG